MRRLARLLIAFTLLAATAAHAETTTSATDMPASSMGGMNMKMALPPMPAVYAGQADKPGAPVFKGLGDHRHPISTQNAQTQALFDQGVRLLFGFNHAEAIRSCREASRLDPNCASCCWGIP